MIHVRDYLTADEIREAYETGLAIYDAAREQNRAHRFDPDDPKLPEKNGQSQIAEVFGRRFLGLPAVSGPFDPDADVGDAPGWEIRWSTAGLRIYPAEPAERRYLLVTGYGADQRLVGWLVGAEGRKPKYRDERYPTPPKWYVPVSVLRDVRELPAAPARGARFRLLTCGRCGDEVRVYELPRPFIDPARYVCGECALVAKEPEQLALVEPVKTRTRSETRSYDPAMAELPI